jgi:hypothetical protein
LKRIISYISAMTSAFQALHRLLSATPPLRTIAGALLGAAGVAGIAGFLGLTGCGGSMSMKKSEQGLSGTFTTYGPPAVIANCEPLVTQAEKDSCKRDNQRVIEEPYQSELIIRNLGTRESVKSSLDAQGSFKVELLPGSYEICMNGECSDPLDVRMGEFTTYGQRLPRPAASGAAGASSAPAPSDTARTAR